MCPRPQREQDVSPAKAQSVGLGNSAQACLRVKEAGAEGKLRKASAQQVTGSERAQNRGGPGGQVYPTERTPSYLSTMTTAFTHMIRGALFRAH